MKRYICIHGHFYQPPRENPWLEEIELQDSAYPYHDWNERINAECYAPNGVSRILDDAERIVRIVNNYANISFNFGPTVLAWMEQHARDTYERILEADRLSIERFSGHGSAIAQAYNHMIMPLANQRDKVTQVKWGIADFVMRFDRHPEGLWLPETAVDIDTLEVLAEHGITFTILAPRQAARFRRIGEEEWEQVENDHINSTRAYVQNLPSGRSINLFFYDGPVSQAIAFEQLLSSGHALADRLVGVFEHLEDTGDAQLVNIATDGESYGHHHRHGDMALAFALHELERREGVEVTNYGEFLEMYPPEYEVEIKEQSSWSCAHGVGRWMSDCGCNSGGRPEWNQKWREPLRKALDWLRDDAEPRFEQAAGELFRDPWAARDDYIEVISNREDDSIDSFLNKHASHDLIEEEHIRALLLMELQRNLLLMYTSCGWFFDELSGIETVQVIQYAGRAVQIAKEIFGASIEEGFVSRLEAAPSNVSDHPNGRIIYERMVRPAMVDLLKVGGHYAVSSVFDEENSRDRVFCYDVAREDYERLPAGRMSLVMGRVRIRSIITRESAVVSFGVIHLGDHNIVGGVRKFQGNEAYTRLVRETSEAFSRGDITETILRLDEHFGKQRYTIMSLFRDDQRRILDRILDTMLEGVEQSYRRVYEDNVPLMRSLSSLGAPLPRVLRTTAEFVLNRDLQRVFASGEIDIEYVNGVFQDTSTWKLKLDSVGLSYIIQRSVERVGEEIAEYPEDLDRIRELNSLVALTQSLPFEVDLWKVQNVYYDLRERLRGAADQPPPSEEWLKEFSVLGEQLKVAVSEP